MATALLASPPASTQFISDEELFRKYGKFCGYMAWQFVKRGGSFEGDPLGVRLDTEDAEDLASIATYHLLRIPQRYRDQPPYVKRVIISKIITAWHKRLKYGRSERQSPSYLMPNKANQTIYQHGYHEDYFDSLPGRDGLAEHTQVSFDSAAVLELLPKLDEGQRIVLELYFGLNGIPAIGVARIAIKLARTRWWVEARLAAGLKELREKLKIVPSNLLPPTVL